MSKSDLSPRTSSSVVQLSMFYLLVTLTYSSFSSVLIYLHQKYRHRGLGETYLTANASASILVYVFAPYILAKIKVESKKMILGCALGYFINVFLPALFAFKDQNTVPSSFRFAVEILGNLIGGASSGIFMVLNGVYLT